MMPKWCKASWSNVETLVCIHVLVVELRLEITIFVRNFHLNCLFPLNIPLNTREYGEKIWRRIIENRYYLDAFDEIMLERQNFATKLNDGDTFTISRIFWHLAV